MDSNCKLSFTEEIEEKKWVQISPDFVKFYLMFNLSPKPAGFPYYLK